MKDKSKKKPLVTHIRKATEAELTSIAKWTIGIHNVPEKYGKVLAYFPTHDYNVIKKYRDRLFYTVIQARFLNERRIKLVTTNSKDLEDLRTDWLNYELKEIERLSNIPGMSFSDLHELKKYRDDINNELNQKKEVSGKPEASKKIHLLSIPTKATKDKTLNFWLKLQGNNEKGLPYWESEKEIEHFVNQNFEGFPGVDEIKDFNPNMNKSELYQVTWIFLHTYGKSKGKRQYENLLLNNFIQFRDAKNVYGNIKYQNNEHLRNLYKEFPIS